MSETAVLAFIYSSMLVIPFMWHVIVPAVWVLEIVCSTERLTETIYAIQVEYRP